MRTPRVIIAVALFTATILWTVICFQSSQEPQTITTSSHSESSAFQTFFSSLHTPFSLFPPNAIITLTHDNTTAFLARPAAFGPLLPSAGLKGQLWIGSGFGDDNLRQGAVATGAEGELGCSDVPGWVESYIKSKALAAEAKKSTDGKAVANAAKDKSKRAKDEDSPFGDKGAATDSVNSKMKDKSEPSVDDGTDDYLHHPLPESTVSKSTDKAPAESKGDHADIQSLQEGAEITGKVVLLSRGGCGFLEKVKWAQRRGAIALIVGDDTTGGPLIQMYARGDTSNVSIPSIFTSRTTAHLLSSLIGPGSYIEDIIDENGKPILKVEHTDKRRKGKKPGSRPTFTPTTALSRPTHTTKATLKGTKGKPRNQGAKAEVKSVITTTEEPGWFTSLFRSSSRAESKSERSRPPSSGQLDWVLVDDWKDDGKSGSKRISTKTGQKADTRENAAPKDKVEVKAASSAASADDFVIGVQDWRDPDLLVSTTPKEENVAKVPAAKSDENVDPAFQVPEIKLVKEGRKKHLGGALQEIPEYKPALRGGSITPGSGEYPTKASSAIDESKAKEEAKDSIEPESASKGLLTTIFGDDEENVEFFSPTSAVELDGYEVSEDEEEGEEENNRDDESEGLWVTLTPTNGASPFLDTLLVLVVSPLVTLTVVYALLLIRSRIRRRRWRAPKSVVEQLPVRTYQTITSGSQSPRLPSPTSSSVTTPLLQQSLQSHPTRSRPRSRTTTGVPEPGDLIRANSSPLQIPPIRSQEHEKHIGESEWRNQMTKQVECVVCLEEYVDGVSRVMSLPCGHEFHADCITPWLTTRRRTCPICKGDVVRSLARGSPSSPRYEPYRDDSDDDIQAQAAETVNTSSSSSLPIAPDLLPNSTDLERGMSPTPTRPRRTNLAGSWRNLLSSQLGGSTSRSPQQEDRDR